MQRLPNNARTPLEYDDYVFQVFPALLYRSKAELSKKHKASRSRSNSRSSTLFRKSSSSTGGSNSSSMSITGSNNGSSQNDEEKLLLERIEHEEKLNDVVIAEVKSGLRRESLRYGQHIQLLHLKTGLSLSLPYLHLPLFLS